MTELYDDNADEHTGDDDSDGDSHDCDDGDDDGHDDNGDKDDGDAELVKSALPTRTTVKTIFKEVTRKTMKSKTFTNQ